VTTPTLHKKHPPKASPLREASIQVTRNDKEPSTQKKKT